MADTCADISSTTSQITTSSSIKSKHKLSFHHPRLGSYSLPRPQPAKVAKRNARERNRVKQVNCGFEMLRKHIPSAARAKKISKVETLRHAVEYIRGLQTLLHSHGASFDFVPDAIAGANAGNDGNEENGSNDDLDEQEQQQEQQQEVLPTSSSTSLGGNHGSAFMGLEESHVPNNGSLVMSHDVSHNGCRPEMMTYCPLTPCTPTTPYLSSSGYGSGYGNSFMFESADNVGFAPLATSSPHVKTHNRCAEEEELLDVIVSWQDQEEWHHNS